MKIKEQIANEIREYLQEGQNYIQCDKPEYSFALQFDLAKVTTYVDPERNYTEYDIIGEFFPGLSYIMIGEAELCKSDVIEIVNMAAENYTILV